MCIIWLPCSILKKLLMMHQMPLIRWYNPYPQLFLSSQLFSRCNHVMQWNESSRLMGRVPGEVFTLLVKKKKKWGLGLGISPRTNNCVLQVSGWVSIPDITWSFVYCQEWPLSNRPVITLSFIRWGPETKQNTCSAPFNLPANHYKSLIYSSHDGLTYLLLPT